MPSRISGIIQDSALKNEIVRRLSENDSVALFGQLAAEASELLSSVGPNDEIPQISRQTEAIILSIGRPVFNIVGNSFMVAETDEWGLRLNNSRQAIETALRAVGRIEVENHPGYDWLGTGWVIRPNVVVTNRHVAQEFAIKADNLYKFRNNFMGKKIKARIDTKEEYQSGNEIQFKIEEVLYIAEHQGFDVAFLRVAPQSDEGLPLPAPISLSDSIPEAGTNVAAIGYPAKDSRNNFEDMEKIFGSVYDVKRLAPGQITGMPEEGIMSHDCSTLGGNSGSVIIDISTGNAVGLHFAGKYLQGNFAVNSLTVASILESLDQ
jgi:endonuclease G